MINFNQIVSICKKECQNVGQFEGILSLTIIQNNENTALQEWRLIAQYKNTNDDFEYVKLEKLGDQLIYQKTQLPFGYAAFETIEVQLEKAYGLAQVEAKSTCTIFKLYFPLSPFDTEPLWSMNFLNGAHAYVGANTGKVEIQENN